MLPDDPRHGTRAGFYAHRKDGETACARCRRAAATYEAMRQAGKITPEIPAFGTVRRIQALMALGYTTNEIAARAGLSGSHVRMLAQQRSVYGEVASKVDAAYEALSGTVPTPTPTREWLRERATRCRYLPPLAWDDIDDPNERPSFGDAAEGPFDPIVVERILGGDWTLRATKSERWEVIERWSGSDNELERRTGWNVARDRREMRASTCDTTEAA
ncbi:hypothetical protein [Nocardioides kribbensis]|uniref:Helix-turn-helix domain-containing protein n=1 Tax=Nocardioides kribbensis TaxID=305517 RepID=A0ABV1NZ37_9ACTN